MNEKSFNKRLELLKSIRPRTIRDHWKDFVELGFGIGFSKNVETRNGFMNRTGLYTKRDDTWFLEAKNALPLE